MKLTNAGQWLLALKEGDVTFDDIKNTIDQASRSDKFDYDMSKGKHAVFHTILRDLDTLCQSGDAIRTFDRVSEEEVSEIYRITPRGRKRAETF